MSAWAKVRLGDVAAIQRNAVDPAQISKSTSYLGLEDIEKGGKILGTHTVGESGLSSPKFKFTEKHVLFGKLRPYLAKVARPNFAGVCSTDILPINPGVELDRSYLAHFLLLPGTVALAAERATGVNLPRISPTLLSDFLIPLPPIAEQQRIATVLDQADELRAKRAKAIALIGDLAESIFFEMFIAADGMRAKWPLRGVSEVCTLVVDCINRTAPTVDGPTPYKMIRTTNVRNGNVDLTKARYVDSDTFARWNKRATPMPGDVLLTREAPVGEAGIIRSDEKVFLGQRLMLYRVNNELITPEYLLAAFRSNFLARQFEKFGSGSTVKHLPLPACRSFKVPLPPLALQRCYEDRMRSLNAMRASQRADLRHLDELFNSLQAKAFRREL